MSEENKKYFWIKLKDDFFKRHEIKVIEAMPNGKEYVLFYLKLLVESVSHDGSLRFSDTIPYSPDMLAAITNTNVDTVRVALELFEQLDLMDVLDDKTLYMKEIEEITGCETKWAEKKRVWRLEQKSNQKLLGQTEDNVLKNEDNVRAMSDKSIEIREQSIEKREQNIKKEKKEIIKEKNSPTAQTTKKFVKPTVDEVEAYCIERNNNVDAEAFVDFYDSKGWLIGKNPMKDWKAAVRTWERKNKTNYTKVNSVGQFNTMTKQQQQMQGWKELTAKYAAMEELNEVEQPVDIWAVK